MEKPRDDLKVQDRSSDRSLLPLTTTDTTPEKKNSLAFLDGLRGIAALVVYLHHHITEYYGNETDLMHPWGYQGRHHFGQLPFLHLFFAGGTPAVMMFFVLSGYVLSRGTLRMLQSGKESSSILKYLLDALLRRPVRLWLPPIIVSLPVAILFHTPLRPVGVFMIYQSSLVAELGAYVSSLLETINPFIGHGPFQQSFAYLPPVWTMAYELTGSLMVYAFLAICGPFLNTRQRMIALLIALPVSFEYGHFSLPPFVLGMLIAQVDVAQLDQPLIDRIPQHRRPLVFNAIFVLGWYLLSYLGSLSKSDSPWFGIPIGWIPYIFYHNPSFAVNIVGAFLMVYAALRLPWLQDLLNRAQWLGRVSFALYLTHVPVLWIIGIRLQRFLGKPVAEGDEKAFFDGWLPLPDVGPLGLTTRYLAMQAIILPLNLALSELVTVWVDQGSVTASKQFASRVMQRLHL